MNVEEKKLARRNAIADRLRDEAINESKGDVDEAIQEHANLLAFLVAHFALAITESPGEAHNNVKCVADAAEHLVSINRPMN